MLAGRPHDLMTIDMGHFEIGDDGVEAVAREGMNRVGARGEGRHMVSIIEQQARHPAHGGMVVVDDKEAGHGRRDASTGPGGRAASPGYVAVAGLVRADLRSVQRPITSRPSTGAASPLSRARLSARAAPLDEVDNRPASGLRVDIELVDETPATGKA